MRREANPLKPLVLSTLLLASFAPAWAQTTNWVAYNDHRGGPIIPPHVSNPGRWGTALRVTTINMGAPADASGNLTNFLTGQQLPVTVAFARTTAPDDFGTVTTNGIPAPGTPAFQLFYGICDLSNDGIVGVDALDNDFVTITFNNLNPAKHYVFRGTAARGGGYAPRWTVATISADGWVDAHLNGTGPGVITSNNYPANLGAGQAAWNSGHNREGAVVGWDFITPRPDGSFTIDCKQYVGPTPNGGATDANYGYSFGAMLLAEVEAAKPVVTSNPVPTTMVEQNRSFSLSVAADGSPLLYQWYKETVGPVAGATFPTFSVARAALTDSGRYYAVVYNPLGSSTSSVAQVSVSMDITAPSIGAAIAYPSVDFNGTAVNDQIIVEFNEPVQASSVSSPSRYTVPGGGNPVSVVVTNDTTVVLKLASPMPEDTAFSVTANGMVDLVGNTAGSSQAQFRTWVSGPGNGLLFEAFDSGPGVEVSVLTSSPNYPNNAYLRQTMGRFDTRLVYPDDTHGAYGARIRGVFIPPVSGAWVFFFRTFDRGVVYLNPNGLDPAGAIEILRESTGNNPRNWDKFSSPKFNLRAGQGYYIEGQYQADTSGTDVMKVAARLDGTGYPQPVDVLDTIVDTNAVAGAAIGYPLAPRDLGGTLSIIQGPANTTVEENHFATFSVLLNNPSKAAVFYQWFKNGSPIQNANGPTYSFQTVLADSGATFSVQASKIGSSVSSGTASLTVVHDVTPPHAISARSYPSNLNQVVIEFDEIVNSDTATDNFNYNLVELIANPTSTELLTNGRIAILTFNETLVSNTVYNIEIMLVTDLVGLKVTPEPTRLTFTGSVVQGPGLEISLVNNSAIITWPAPSTGFILEQTDSLVLPVTSTVWTPVGIAPSVINGRNTVSVPVAGTRIFRLRQ